MAYTAIWRHEPMAAYPANVKAYPQDWVDEFDDHSKLFQLYAKTLDHHAIRSPALAAMLEETLRLERVAPHSSLPATFSHDFLTQKKRHELMHLIPLLTEKAQQHRCHTVIDVGSGHGHLGRTLGSIINLPVICLEKDEALINQGQVVASKQGKEKALTFVAQDLMPELLQFFPDSPFAALNLKAPSLLVGLHTCGNLGISQILLGLHSLQHQINPLINIPCCYFHLHPQLETNLSPLSQLYPVAWTPQALTLATRAHRRQDEKEYLAMARVKEYRYTLQLFFHEELGLSDFFPVGSSHQRLYRKSFSEYATAKFQQLGLALPGQHSFQGFYENALTQKKVRDLFTMTLLRWRFGRILEKALIVDRALWLEEHGYRAELFTLFDEAISPRNIVLYATKC